MPLKPSLNVCSQKSIKPNLGLVNIFILNESLILNLFLFNRSYKFQQCITKLMIVTRVKNVLINFTSFINDMWRKIFLKVFSSKTKYMEIFGVSEENFLFVEISH